jgi:hypothetical protein
MGAFTDTINVLAMDGGVLGGTGTLTALSYRLFGGTINANLGAGTVSQESGTTALNGTAAARIENDNGGALTVDGTVAATQSGTWNVTTVTAVTPLGKRPISALKAIKTSTSATRMETIVVISRPCP